MKLATIESPFAYSPLTSPHHIRLLEVQQDEDDSAPLRCKLRDTDIDDDARVPYIALSYTWGQPDFTEPLILNNAIKLITPNLAGALRRFRQVGRRIWVDAVCINQEDNKEKSEQIPLMRNIYHNASCVMVWLGDKSEDVESFKVLRAAAGNGYAKLKPDDDFTESLSTHALRIAQHPWFNRRWIIQEITLNPCVIFHCGNVEIPWQRLVMIIQETSSVSSSQTQGVDHIMSLWWIWISWSMPHVTPKVFWNQNSVFSTQGMVDNTNMFSLLNAFDNFDCSDQRDRIYAILGLKQDEIPVKINYSHTIGRVFIDFATVYANNRARGKGISNLFSILGETSLRSRGKLPRELPSWVPDWRIPSPGELPFTANFLTGEGISTSGDQTHHILRISVSYRDLPSLSHGGAPVRISWKVCREEGEDFLDFITRVMLIIITDRPHGWDRLSNESIWNWMKSNFLGEILPWTDASRFIGEAESQNKITSLLVNESDSLRHLLGKCWEESQVIDLDPDHERESSREVLMPYMRLGPTIRAVFIGKEIHISSGEGMQGSFPGITFSDVEVGDSVYVMSNTLYVQKYLHSRREIQQGDMVNTAPGMILQEMTTNIPGQSCFSFMSCCYLLNFWKRGWEERQSKMSSLKNLHIF
ncbi:heterokaryon incompatibility protein-domain-containing protein [Annulohypoxylon nitens]|nr:heterokaryon incompatibility protein-domain-containing protein [Annulohypoxylon nitens]